MLNLILIAGIWINPVNVSSLVTLGDACLIRSIHAPYRDSNRVKIKLPCNEVAAIINKEIE